MKKYSHEQIEAKWQKLWEERNVYKTDLDAAKKPFYNLMMFPYPSAEGLHIGSVYTFSGIDTYGRYKRMKGYDVFEPFGLDGFGIHSENYAIKIQENILDVSTRTEKHYYDQMHRAGTMIDWSRKLETYDERYYKWTQWLFVQFFKAGLAYRKQSDVNWCPGCKTVLSDEQVIDGKCERSGDDVTKKSMNQWFFKITDYAQRLLENLEDLNWAEDVKIGQRNWIGRSNGARIRFKILVDRQEKDDNLEVFTTAHDTLPGCTFMVVAPESEFLQNYKKQISNWTEVESYIEKSAMKPELERQIAKDKTGILIQGIEALHPITNRSLPIYVADYVLVSYGTGAIMAVPGHDARDLEFAKKYNIEIIYLVEGKSGFVEYSEIKERPDQYKLINAGELDGLNFKEVRNEILGILKKQRSGETVTEYKLRDWCVSRQRYWGPPIPMIFCKTCENVQDGYFKDTMPGWWPDENLPVKLPKITDFEDTLPDGSGKGPLAKFPDFFQTTCPKCGGEAVRETDVSDPFVDSCWYFLRYPFTEYNEIPFGGNFKGQNSLFDPAINEKELGLAIERMEKWGPVTSYIGGKEHTVLHLLYARFITMAFYDLGYLDFEEPFSRFYGHGLITKDGAKMSKSKGNVINPDEYFDLYGADAVRMYLRFMGPFDQGGDWSDTGMKGMSKFVHRVWTTYQKVLSEKATDKKDISTAYLDKTIKKIDEDLDNLKFNTAIAEIMKFFNWFDKTEDELSSIQKRNVLEKFLLVLAPFMPHLTEELWEQFGHDKSIHLEDWPEITEENLKEQIVTVAIQVDGKTRGTIKVNVGLSEGEVLNLALKEEGVKRHVRSDSPSKTVYVQDRILNILN